MYDLIERVIYAATRGAVRAYLDTLREAVTAEEEAPTGEDKRRASRVLDIIRRRLPPSEQGASGRVPSSRPV